MMRDLLIGAALAGSLLLGACSSSPERPSNPSSWLNETPWARAAALPPAPTGAGWTHLRIGQRKPTQYRFVRHDGRPALQADSDGGDSLVRHALGLSGPALGRLRFSWYVDSHNPIADVGDPQSDDAVVRLILQFDGDRSTFSARDQRLSDLLQALTGEPLPYATLMYVWDPERPVGTVIPHPRSARIRKLVVVSGSEGLGRWMELERDLNADYEQVFGQPPVRLTGLALMTDSNNTGHPSRAWYGPLRWLAPGG